MSLHRFQNPAVGSTPRKALGDHQQRLPTTPKGTRAAGPSSIRTPILGKVNEPKITTQAISSASKTAKTPKLKIVQKQKITPKRNTNTSDSNNSKNRAVDRASISMVHDTVQIKNDLIMYKEDLVLEIKENMALREEIEEKEQLVSAQQREIDELKSHASHQKTEIRNLNELLSDENCARKFVEIEANHALNTTIREKDARIQELTAELSQKDKSIQLKVELIDQLEGAVKGLRKDLVKLQGSGTGDGTSETSRSFRKSISNLQATLEENLANADRRFKAWEAKHKEELRDVKKSYDEELIFLKSTLTSKNAELRDLQEQLKNRGDSSYNENSSKNLRQELENANQKIIQLEAELLTHDDSSLQAIVLEGQLHQAVKLNTELAKQLKAKKEEFDELFQYADQQTSAVSDLKKKLKILGAEQSKPKEEEAPETAGDQVKENALQNQLTVENTKNSELEAKLESLDKELGLTKVDLRLMARENRILKQELEAFKEQRAASLKAAEESLHDSNIAKNTISKLIKEKESMKACLEEQTAKNILDSSLLTAANEKVQMLTSDNDKLACDLKDSETALGVCQESLKNLEEQLNEKTKLLGDAEICIQSLTMKVELLRETCAVLDLQLNDFEKSYVAKEKEVEKLARVKGTLEEENESLKASMQKIKIELNEAISLRNFYEQRYKSVTESLNSGEKRALEDVKVAQQKLQESISKSSDLAAKVSELTKKLDDAKVGRSQLELNLRVIKREKDNISAQMEDLALKNANLLQKVSTLAAALEESIEKGEDIKNRYEALSSQQELLDNEKIEKQVQLQATLRQQAKLIEFLQQKNEGLLKKKDKRFQIFGKRDENVTPPRPRSSRDTAAVKESEDREESTPSLTPVHLIREHFNVQKLEQTAESLREKLTQLKLQKVATFDPPINSPIKEESVLLKKSG